jgi:5'(3')-deoxyribonucleotidase
MKLGIDMDGCLADFNSSFIDRAVGVLGVDKFPERPFEITSWDYPQMYGYTPEEIKLVWDNIEKDELFWYHLQPYKDSFYAMREITKLWEAHHDVYFITNRPGTRAKLQTEAWLLTFGTGIMPTVLLSADKAGCCNSLKIDFYIDDKAENCESVKKNTLTNCLMMAQPWNYDIPGVPRIPDWKAFFEAVKESGEVIN